MKDEEKILFATSIAMELSKGLNVKELCDLIGFINQISCSLGALLNIKKTNQK